MIPMVGLELFGNCNGFFGGDSYGPKRVEAYGVDWIVVRDEDRRPMFASFDSTKEMCRYLKLWNAL